MPEKKKIAAVLVQFEGEEEPVLLPWEKFLVHWDRARFASGYWTSGRVKEASEGVGEYD